MLFNTLEYLIFFAAVTGVYFSVPQKYRWVLLLAASYYFYMCWKAEYIVLILASTLINYVCGLKMGVIPEKRKRRPWLLLSLFVNLGLLFGFKYFNFFNASAREILGRLDISYHLPSFNMLLPVGISFYTFQILSYSIEVYRGNQRAERHPGIFALYVAFFPQLVAGPIERAGHLLPQFYNKINFDYDRVVGGLRLMMWGLVKKMVIADQLAVCVNSVYNNAAEFEGIPLILATLFYAFQIFCDFSGYTDIARGSARILGIDLMENFNRPYFAKSIGEFWHRWHISLSTWFRDYLYIPLGGNRVSSNRHYFNVFVTFLLSGLWHGANWTFVVWGGLHALYMMASMLSASFRVRAAELAGLSKHPLLAKCVRTGITFGLVCFAWIFFRANSISDATYIAGHLFTGLPGQLKGLAAGRVVFSELAGFSEWELLRSLFCIALLEAVHLFERKKGIIDIVASQPLVVRWLIYVTMALLIFDLGRIDEIPFIYFQF